MPRKKPRKPPETFRPKGAGAWIPALTIERHPRAEVILTRTTLDYEGRLSS